MKSLSNILKTIDQLFIAYQAQRPLPEDEQALRYAQLRLEWTYHSNALEGNSLTLGETAFYLREGLTSEGKPLVDFLEARNHAEAIDWLSQHVTAKTPMSEGFMKDLNALLHQGITQRPALGAGGQTIMRKITPGVYKRQPNHVLTLSGTIHYYVEPLQVPGAMQALVEKIRTEEKIAHPVQLASDAHYELTRIHPFDDCNGRCARLLLNLLLMRAGFPPIVIRQEERRRYLEALEHADAGDATPFTLFVAEHVQQSLQAQT